MNPQAKEKLEQFIVEQMTLMEEEMGVLAQKYKPHFGQDLAAYFKWLNMAYQLKSVIPILDEDTISPQALSQPLGKSEGFKF
ncbi:MAG: hypothetical protein B7Y39_08890 [Bdellovibrio sp. 28-41-41]|nr:MAG: hypothetical protein B7Y39_08890 [Bdellovibrio sp. 28-41-41]